MDPSRGLGSSNPVLSSPQPEPLLCPQSPGPSATSAGLAACGVAAAWEARCFEQGGSLQKPDILLMIKILHDFMHIDRQNPTKIPILVVCAVYIKSCGISTMNSFGEEPKRAPFLRAATMRMIVFWGLYWGSSLWKPSCEPGLVYNGVVNVATGMILCVCSVYMYTYLYIYIYAYIYICTDIHICDGFQQYTLWLIRIERLVR